MISRERLRTIVEEVDTPAGRRFDLLIQSLIVVSLVSFSVETLPGLSGGTTEALEWVEKVTVAIFAVEYLLRLLLAEKKIGFAVSFYGLIDLAAILPFFVFSGVDLRSIRVFRLLRLFRAFKLLRYSKAIQRFHLAFRLVREELVLFFCVTMMLLFFSSVGIYYFENPEQPEAFASVFHGLWWSVATLTTVGYGDIYPVTLGGKIFTFFILMIGLGNCRCSQWDVCYGPV